MGARDGASAWRLVLRDDALALLAFRPRPA